MCRRHLRSSLLLYVCLCTTLSQAAPSAMDAAPALTRQSLIGAWNLVGIQYEGPHGPLTDPFYQADSIGIIMYDPSGWMSVHISAPHRVAWEGAASRVPPSATDPDLQRKAGAYDTYYTYFGTWEFDPKTSVVTHHLKAALIPGESGIDYTQRVTLERGRLVFTNRSTEHGEDRVRKKVWERAGGAQ